jgi:hypothetical protein
LSAPIVVLVRLTLVDSNPVVAAALREAFASFLEVQVVAGDLIAVAENAVVSPANG